MEVWDCEKQEYGMAARETHVEVRPRGTEPAAGSAGESLACLFLLPGTQVPCASCGAVC